MYGDGANTLQMLLIFGGPFAGAVVAGFSSTSEHLRASGGMAFAAIMLFASLGLFRGSSLWSSTGSRTTARGCRDAGGQIGRHRYDTEAEGTVADEAPGGHDGPVSGER